MSSLFDIFRSKFELKSKLTLKDIKNNLSNSFFSNREGKTDKLKLSDPFFSNNTQENEKIYRGNIYNEEKGTQYTSAILFEDVSKGKYNSPVKLYCSCSDFQYRFAPYLEDKRAYLPPYKGGGKMVEYKPKGKRPSVNPSHVCSCCKHLVKVIQYVEQDSSFNN